MMNPPILVFDPNPFCYGSISACLSIVTHLKEYHKVLLARDCSEELAGDAFDQIIRCDVKDVSVVASVLAQLQPIRAYVSISNQTNIQTVVARNIPLIFIDILFWMQEVPHLAMKEALLYLAENYPGTKEAGLRFAPLMNHLEIVGPLIEKKEGGKRSTKDLLLVNFGGSESPFVIPGLNTPYPELMTSLILAAGAADYFQEVYIATGNKAVISILNSDLEIPPNVYVQSLTHENFLQTLGCASMFLTSPGLNAPFEGFYHDIPTWFLPPQNVTQVRQLEVYQRAGLHKQERLNLTELFPEFDLLSKASEKENTIRVLYILERLNIEPKQQSIIIQSLRRAFRSSRYPSIRKILLKQQAAFCNMLGPIGGERSARLIQRSLS